MRILKWIGLVTIILIILIGASFFILSKDTQKLSDKSALELQIKQISEADNSYFALEEISSEMAKLDPNISDQEFVQNNSALLGRFLDISQKRGYVLPGTANYRQFSMDNLPVPKLGPYRQLARLSLLKAKEDFKNNKVQGADEAIQVLGIGKQIADGTPLIVYLMGNAIQADAANTLTEFKKDYSFTPEQYGKIKLAQDTRSGLANAFRWEYWTGRNSLLETVESVKGKSVNAGYSFKPNETDNELVQIYTNLTKIASQPCSVKTVVTQSDDNYPKWYEPNSVGKVITSLLETSLAGTKQKECNKQEKIENLLK